MRIASVAILAAAALAAAPSVAGHPERATKATVRVVSFDPLTVRGTGFAPRERVRVDLSGTAVARRRAVALASGAFTVRFDGVAVTRCDLVRVVAVGSRGSRAGLKHLPSPACLPA